MNRFFIIITFLLCSVSYAIGQGSVGIKTNLLYGAWTLTPNLGVEIGLGKRTTLDIAGGYNPWNVNTNDKRNEKLAHFIVQPEFRYFLCERFNGHFFGAHALYTQYNISRHELRMLFGKNSKNRRFEGYGYGAGISYGYQLMLGTHWNLEFEIGVGYARLEYDKYDARRCGKKLGDYHKNYFGPTKAGISIIYIIK